MKKLLLLIVLFYGIFNASNTGAQSYVWTVAGIPGAGIGGFSGDGGPATNAELNSGEGVGIDGAGNIYFSDMGNDRIRKVTAATGIITTIAGVGGYGGFSGDGGPGTAARLKTPYGLAVDVAGNCYFADMHNNRIRRIDAVTGIITTVAGTGAPLYSGDGGPATSAEIDMPVNVFVDNGTNDLYFSAGGRIRKVAAATGIITTIAGSSGGGFSGDGGPATAAQIDNSAAGIAMDSSGNIYFADRNNNRIRKITASTGIITTVAGTGTSGPFGDGGPATMADISGPIGLVIDAAGNLIIADNEHNRVREVNVATGIITSIGGCGCLTTTEGAPATGSFLHPEFLCLGSGCGGDLYLTNWSEGNQVRKITNIGLSTSINFGSGAVCTGETLLLTTGSGGGKWSSSNATVATIDSATGFLTGLAPGSVTVTYVLDGCTSTAVVTVGGILGAHTVTGGGSLCAGGVGFHIGLSGSQPGATYQLFNGISAIGAPVAGTGGSLDFGILSLPGTYTVIASLIVSGCSVNMIGSATISVIPTDTLYSSQDTALCALSDAEHFILTAPPASGYSWNDGHTGPTDTIFSGGNFWVAYTIGCNAYTDTFHVMVITVPPPITGPDSVCLGNQVFLSDPLPGGIWTSASGAIAVVDSVTGTVTGISPGTTTIVYTIYNTCSATMSIATLDSPCNTSSTLLNKILASDRSSVLVLPNPATNELIITLDKNDYNTLSITDNLGQQLIQQKITETETTLNIQSLPPGMYYITLKGDDGMKVEKFVKM